MRKLSILSFAVVCFCLGSRAVAQELPLSAEQQAAASQVVVAAHAVAHQAQLLSEAERPRQACVDAAPKPACVPIKSWRTAVMTVRDDAGRSTEQEVQYPVFDLQGKFIETGDNTLCWHWCQQVCNGALCHMMCWTHCASGGEGDPRPHQTSLTIEAKDVAQSTPTKL